MTIRRSHTSHPIPSHPIPSYPSIQSRSPPYPTRLDMLLAVGGYPRDPTLHASIRTLLKSVSQSISQSLAHSLAHSLKLITPSSVGQSLKLTCTLAPSLPTVRQVALREDDRGLTPYLWALLHVCVCMCLGVC